jgi:O-antigen/teichoic acid export membrane protein
MEYASKRIAKNTLFVFSARASELVSGVLIISLASRYLGVTEFGRYSLIWALAIILSPIVAFGCERIVIRDAAVEEDKAAVLVTSALMLNCLMSIVVFVVAILIAVAFELTSKGAITAVYLAVLSQVLMVMTKTVGSVFIAYEKMSYNLLITIITSVLTVLLTFVVTCSALGMTGLFMALTVANIVGLCISFGILKFKLVRLQTNISIQGLKYVFIESFPIALSTFIGQGYRYINVFLLKLFEDFAQVSFYQAPWRIISPISQFPASFLLAVAPALSRMANDESSRSCFKYSYLEALKYILIIALPVCLYVTMYASTIVSLLFGKAFIEASRSFQILIWAILPLFAKGLLNLVLTSIRKQRVMAISNGVALALNVLFAFVLIPQYGHIGASLAFLLSSVGLVIVDFYFVYKYIGSVPVHRIILRPLLACSIAYMFTLLLASILNMVSISICFLSIYIGLLLLLKTFRREEVRAFKSVGRKKIS